MTPVTVDQGDSPIVLGLPHTGTFVPDTVAANLNDNGRKLADTDWHIDRLYEGLLDGATIVRANFHRYVIDANRDPQETSLYPGQNTTTLVPLTDFDGRDIWETPPTAAEIDARRHAFHAPYHAAMQAELDRLRARHGVAILYDCHSIRSRIPYLFDGTLPDFNIGTNMGATCAARIETATTGICEAAIAYSTTLNGRFRGGWTTRHYGKPDKGIHAIQMELAQSTYLTNQAPPWTYDNTKAAVLRPLLTKILTNLAALAPTLGGKS
ncbi:N-formylglutamate deformylase [Yoonia sediminilitoris]|uniref:Formiminoglutamase n=1 Tax=Yoonia sediminilitoris TaxID=1286148 RepID=A0A2T6KLN2_9RHOB|nr:N-formylglutamate deformylase [Yoonia sediminilitoris]PUB17094.1 formiminoglutamase [Yoonia sediminilitoris]RCW97389.1 formiminoglutamase [Yoonia sediminilitoris]